MAGIDCTDYGRLTRQREISVQAHRLPLVVAAVAVSVMSMQGRAAEGLESDAIDSVIVTGTRQSGIKAADSAANIQAISSATIEKTPSARIR
jgi:hypothetical protein